MALFDNINSRYTKSMEHGGSYERDAAIGGYDRKELRGLSKQAKRGTLTQRERARYKYLKDERGGRRKRGLLSGLGGAGAVLAGLAASGKLGGLGGGVGGGAGIMDAIKEKLAGAQEKSRLKKFRKEGSKELQDMFKKEAMSDLPGFGNYDPVGLQDVPLESEEDSLRIADELDRNVDFNRAGSPRGRGDNIDRAAAIANQADFPLDVNPIYQDFSGELSEELGEGDLSRISEAGAPAQDFSGELSDDVGEGDLYEALEMARNNASRVSSENPLPTGITSTQRNTAPEVDLGGMLTQEELDAENDKPGRIGEEPTRGSDRPNVSQIFDALNRSKASEINVDPEGLASSPAMAKQVLAQLNRRREQIGLKPVEKLSEKIMQETDAIDNHLQRKNQGSSISMPRGASSGQPQGPRALVDQILNRYN